MCLYTNWRFPRISTKPIKVIKKIEKTYNRDHSYRYITPCQRTLVTSRVLTPEFDIENIFDFIGVTLSFNTEEHQIHGGFIHCYSCNNMPKTDECYEAEIPPYTLYFISDDGSEYCAKKLIITDKRFTL